MPVYEWAHWLEPALRSDPFVAARLVVVDGWRDRGRPPGEFFFAPSGILNHHTACFARDGHDPQSCINGIVNGVNGTPPPISQLLATWNPPGTRLDRSRPDPRMVLIAAGRANHAGAAEPGDHYRWGAPEGNGSSIGMEQCGPGPWPDIVIELIERADAAICRDRGWSVEHIDTHDGYARFRKIDASGPWIGEPGLGELDSWNGGILRSRVAQRLAPPPPPPEPPDEEDLDMHPTLWRFDNHKFAVYPGDRKVWMGGEPDVPETKVHEAHVARLEWAGKDSTMHKLDAKSAADRAMWKSMGAIDGPVPKGFDRWGFRKPTS